MAKTYHLGLSKGNPGPCWSNEHRADTVILHARRNADYLPCELWRYLGQRKTTKAQLKAHRAQILEWVNQTEGRNFKRLVVD